VRGRRAAVPARGLRRIGGFEEFLAAIADPQHAEHEAMLTWAGGAYDPDEFDPATVRFDDPAKRLRMARQ
jgi:hypothetical protein